MLKLCLVKAHDRDKLAKCQELSASLFFVPVTKELLQLIIE